MAIYYYCSDGSRVSEATIQRKYSLSLREAYGTMTVAPICEGCGRARSVHSDHTIARARCKVLHKTELIWHPANYVRSCQVCHNEWENFKSGEWTLHLNVEQRLHFLREHDPEGYLIRVNFTMSELQQELENQIQQQHDRRIQEKEEASTD